MNGSLSRVGRTNFLGRRKFLSLEREFRDIFGNDLSSQRKIACEALTHILTFSKNKIVENTNPKEVEKMRNFLNSASALNESINDKLTIVIQNFSDGSLFQDKIKQNQKILTEIGKKVKDLENIGEEIKILIELKPVHLTVLTFSLHSRTVKLV